MLIAGTKLHNGSTRPLLVSEWIGDEMRRLEYKKVKKGSTVTSPRL